MEYINGPVCVYVTLPHCQKMKSTQFLISHGEYCKILHGDVDVASLYHLITKGNRVTW